MVKIPLSFAFSSQCFIAFRFRIFKVTLWFLRIFCFHRLSFSFPLPLHFLSSCLFPFVHFFFPYIPLFYFSQFAPFPQFCLPFPKSAAPVLPHFLLPWVIQKPKKTHLWAKIHMLFCNECSICTIFTGDSMSELHTTGVRGPGVQLPEAHGF